MNNWNLNEAIEYYKGLDAPQNQFALVELLKEAQEHNGGLLTDDLIEKIAQGFALKVSFLNAVIKRYPSLKTAAVQHRLELCGGKNCAGKGSAALLKHIRQVYGAESGGVSLKGNFSLKICGCLKYCGKGPNIKWDGEIYNSASPELLKKLIEK